jgi:hypothetical protein
MSAPISLLGQSLPTRYRVWVSKTRRSTLCIFAVCRSGSPRSYHGCPAGKSEFFCVVAHPPVSSTCQSFAISDTVSVTTLNFLRRGACRICACGTSSRPASHRHCRRQIAQACCRPLLKLCHSTSLSPGTSALRGQLSCVLRPSDAGSGQRSPHVGSQRPTTFHTYR